MENVKEKLTRDAVLTAMEQNKTIRTQKSLIIILAGVIAALLAYIFKEV